MSDLSIPDWLAPYVREALTDQAPRLRQAVALRGPAPWAAEVNERDLAAAAWLLVLAAQLGGETRDG